MGKQKIVKACPNCGNEDLLVVLNDDGSVSHYYCFKCDGDIFWRSQKFFVEPHKK
jgi:predicted RNA-binding Zn-ribbon protein involved in translation (DUF1610 family)